MTPRAGIVTPLPADDGPIAIPIVNTPWSESMDALAFVDAELQALELRREVLLDMKRRLEMGGGSDMPKPMAKPRTTEASGKAPARPAAPSAGKPANAVQKLLKALQHGPLSAKELKERSAVKNPQLYPALNENPKYFAKLDRSDRLSPWSLTPAGQEAAKELAN